MIGVLGYLKPKCTWNLTLYNTDKLEISWKIEYKILNYKIVKVLISTCILAEERNSKYKKSTEKIARKSI